MKANLVSFHLVPGPFSLDPSLPGQHILVVSDLVHEWNGHSTQICFGSFRTSDSLESLGQEGAWERDIARIFFPASPMGQNLINILSKCVGYFSSRSISNLPSFCKLQSETC